MNVSQIPGAGAPQKSPVQPVPAGVWPIRLADLDFIAAESIGLFVWSDMRPLCGVTGLIDWRLCGALSRALLCRRFDAAPYAVLLYPVVGRFGPRRLFVFGLGPHANWTPTGLGQHAAHAAAVMQRAGAPPLTFAAPAAPYDPHVESAFVDTVLGPGPVKQVLTYRQAA